MALQQTVGNHTVQRLLRQGRDRKETSAQKDPLLNNAVSNLEALRVYSSQQATVQRVNGDQTAVNDNQLYEGAKTAHDQDRNALHTIIEDASEQTADIRLRNSAEWVMQGHQGMKLYAFTPTHDSSTRLEHMFPGQSAGNHAFFPFPAGAMYKKGRLQPPAYYEQDIDSSTNLKPLPPNVEGVQEPGIGLGVVSPSSSSEADVQGLLRHEVQHAADLSGELGSRRGEIRQVMDNALKSYKTEYRAHAFEGPDYNHLSSRTPVIHAGYSWSERQWAIFSDIYGRYEAVSDAWDTDVDLNERQRFRRAVVAFKMPTSVNPQNSTRVDAFNQYIQGRQPADFKPAPPIPKGMLLRPFQKLAHKVQKFKAKQRYKKLLKLVRNLDAEDRRSLIINPGTRAFRIEKLGVITNTKLEAEIRVGMRAGPTRTAELYQ